MADEQKNAKNSNVSETKTDRETDVIFFERF